MSTKQKITLIFLLLIGVFIQVIPLIRSGITYKYGIGFWGPNGHDGVWHLSLINNIRNPIKINMPVFSGEKLVNYHPFFDILISLLSKVTSIPSNYWYFQIFPILSSLTLLFLSFYLGKIITKKFWGGVCLLYLNCMMNSFGWLISFIKYGNFSGESIFWAMQSPSNQINPPYNLSLIFITILLIILFKKINYDKLSFFESLTLVLILVLLPITKIYSVIVAYGLFTLFSLRAYFINKNLNYFKILIISLILSLIIFKIYNPKAQNLLIFKPFWFTNSLIDSPDKLFLPKLSSLRNTIESVGGFNLKLAAIYLFCLIVFIIGNFSWRLLSILQIFRKNIYLDNYIYLIIFILILFPTLFIQKGTNWNTIQFLYYSLFLSNIYLTKFILNIFHSYSRVTIIFLIILSNTLALIGMLPNYLGKIPPTSIPSHEIIALNFLLNQSPGTVLTVPYDKYLKNNFPNTPVPLYAYETSAYVSAYSKHYTYLEDEMNLENSGYDYQGRRQNSLNFFNQKNIFQDRGFLINNQIDYIYLTDIQISKYPLSIEGLFLEKIFDNQYTLIYRVKR